MSNLPEKLTVDPSLLVRRAEELDAKLAERLEQLEAKIQTLNELCAQSELISMGMALRSRLVNDTCVRRMLASTQEGNFLFDVRDTVVGWRIAYGAWEWDITQWIKSILRAGDLAVDVGANLGWFTVVMARLVGAKGSVVAFEPEALNFDLLKRNVEENGFAQRCTLLQLALAEQEGICQLELSPSNLGDHRIRMPPTALYRQDAFAEEHRPAVPVPCKRLDDALRLAGVAEDRPIRFLKIDTQGAEVSILKSAIRALERTEYMLVEYWPYALARAGSSADDFLSCVAQHFYEFAEFKYGDTSPNFKPIAELKQSLLLLDSQDAPPQAQSDYILRKKQKSGIHISVTGGLSSA